jgi:hypothetical protein
MLGFGNTRPGRTAVTAGVACDGDLDVCERFRASLCRQALLTLRYADAAGQVIGDVSVSNRMPGRNQRAAVTIRITLRRCRPATVAASRASGRNGTKAPPCSDRPAALRAAQAPPRSTPESSGRRSGSRCLAASGAIRSGVSRRSLCRNGSSSGRSTARPDGLDRFLCLALRISCLSGQPAWARAANSASRIACRTQLRTASRRASLIAPATGDSQGKIPGDACETAATRTTPAGAARVSGPVHLADADRW